MIEESANIGFDDHVHSLLLDGPPYGVKAVMWVSPGSVAQGQRTLSCFCGKDLHQEVVAPTGDLALAFDAVVQRMLL